MFYGGFIRIRISLPEVEHESLDNLVRRHFVVENTGLPNETNESVQKQLYRKFADDLIFFEGRYQVRLLWNLKKVKQNFLGALNC